MKYILIATFLALFSTLNASQTIAKIPEASGIAYCADSKKFIVVNDEGTYYEMSKKGKILKKVKLGKFDLEGVVCEKETLLFAVENKGLLLVDRKTGQKQKISVNPNYQGKRITLFDDKVGIEGIAKIDNFVYLAKQSKKKKSSFIAVVRLYPLPSRIVDIIPHHIPDTAGLSYHKKFLYMVSDKKDLVIKYNLKARKIEKKISLAKGAWEGIAFDNKDNMYLADDEGRVVKYKSNFYKKSFATNH